MNCSYLEKVGAILGQLELKQWNIDKTVLIQFIILNLFLI